jgi:hypothetical protein
MKAPPVAKKNYMNPFLCNMEPEVQRGSHYFPPVFQRKECPVSLADTERWALSANVGNTKIRSWSKVNAIDVCKQEWGVICHVIRSFKYKYTKPSQQASSIHIVQTGVYYFLCRFVGLGLDCSAIYG